MPTYYGPIADQATYLATLTGLDTIACAAWLRCEGQEVANPSNPLNIAVFGGGSGSGLETGEQGSFYTYADWHAGLRAAAFLLRENPAYAGVLASVGHAPEVQAAAIEASPWAGGHYGGGSGRRGCIVDGVTTAPLIPPQSPSSPSKGAHPVPATGNVYADAVVTNADYLDNLFAPRSLPYTDHIRKYAATLATSPASAPAVNAPQSSDPAPATVDAPISTPTGAVALADAAQLDAENLAAISLGDPPMAAAAPFAGLALAHRYNGVVGVGTGTSVRYVAFRDGVIVGTSAIGSTPTDPTAWGWDTYGIDPNAFGPEAASVPNDVPFVTTSPAVTTIP